MTRNEIVNCIHFAAVHARLRAVAPSTLDAEVLDRVRDAIVRGEIPPGRRINHLRTARQLGVSRGPVRAAMAKLAQEGLVKNVPRRGSFTTPLDRSTVADVYGVREALESFAAAEAARRSPREAIDDLQHSIERMRTYVARKDVRRLVDADLVFHRRVVELSGNRQLEQLWNVTEVSIRRILLFRDRTLSTLRDIPDSHLPTVRALRDRDGAAAAEALRTHIRDACADLVAHWPDHNDDDT
jgi:DNA-binding GntR family transcriptional regulator